MTVSFAAGNDPPDWYSGTYDYAGFTPGSDAFGDTCDFRWYAFSTDEVEGCPGIPQIRYVVLARSRPGSGFFFMSYQEQFFTGDCDTGDYSVAGHTVNFTPDETSCIDGIISGTEAFVDPFGSGVSGTMVFG